MAQRIPQEVIDEIRGKTDIVEIVGQYVQLKKSGKNYLGLCPFHEEKSPSFSVAEDKQIFHCFGCGKGGNVFNFVQELEGVSFPEAVEKVAELEQIPLQGNWVASNREEQGNSKQRQLIELHEKANELFHHLLVRTKAGVEALDYLLERGLTMELIEEFQIGFAPNERKFLVQVFENESYDVELMKESGLFVHRDDGTFVDRFYQRIMFPIRNPQGKTIGFSGRLLKTEKFPGTDQPKYLNSPETELFNKRLVLFNFDKARSMIRKEGEVFLFEGFMDVIAAWQAGIHNGIASMGTSLTSQQLSMIERVTKELVICYDGDSAGIEATNRAIELLNDNSRLNLSVVSVPEGRDPDEYLRKYGEAAFKELALHGRETVFTFKMRYHRLNRNLQNEKEQLDYIEELLQELVAVASPIEQDKYLTQLSTEFQIGRESLQEQLRSLKQESRQQRRAARRQENFAPQIAPVAPTPVTKAPLSLVEKAERNLLFRVFNEQGIRNQLNELSFQFVHDQYQEIYFLLGAFLEERGTFTLPEFLDFLKKEALRKTVIEIAYFSVGDTSSEREIQDLLAVIGKASLADEIKQKKLLQQEASRNGNQQLELELAIEIINLTKQLKKPNS
ncbi:DNA primase [Enterococcus sp. JM4C]|uniref:DNA primase n=1 Tax=Candidatus Enterococcus huntleyi TaxID=1857217 RepID=UPI00137AA9F9|nr:DNA primase [Enterococcus sp. JM4C]KAF1298106.1 DNA primase [Enterococcus sp. JM4C]